MLGLPTHLVKEINISFLYVNHTHADIDAAFSVIANNLRKKSAETLTDLRDMLQNNDIAHGLFNIRDRIAFHIATNVQVRPQPQLFKFEASIGGTLNGFYKRKHDDPRSECGMSLR